MTQHRHSVKKQITSLTMQRLEKEIDSLPDMHPNDPDYKGIKHPPEYLGRTGTFHSTVNGPVEHIGACHAVTRDPSDNNRIAFCEELTVNGEYFLFNMKSKIADASVGSMTTERYGGVVLNDVQINGVSCRVVVLGYNSDGSSLAFHVIGKDIGRECTSTTVRFGENERKLSFGPFGVNGTFGSSPYTKLDIDSAWDNISRQENLQDIVLAVLETFKEF